MVELKGTPSQIGSRWGTINGESIRRHLRDDFLFPAKRNSLTRSDLIERSQRFCKIASKVAPHWLAEAKAIARQTQAEKELYLSYIANAYRQLHLHRAFIRRFL